MNDDRRSKLKLGLNFLPIVACITATICYPQRADAEISDFSRKLAYCEGVYLYLTQLFQVSGKPDAANNVLFRYSRVMIANMWLNVENDVVSSDKIAEFKMARAGLRESFNANPQLAFNASDRCDAFVAEGWRRAKARGIQVWDGKTMDEWQQHMLAGMRAHLGL